MMMSNKAYFFNLAIKWKQTNLLVLMPKAGKNYFLVLAFSSVTFNFTPIMHEI